MRHPAVRPVLAVSTAVFREGRVLLARRGAALGRGLWSLPGGKVEPGETLAEAAARELAEEVGVAGAIIGVAGALDIIRRDPAGALEAHYVVVCHAAHWRSGEASVGPEAAETGWFAPHTLPDPRTMTDGLAGMIAAAAALAGASGDGA
ncbi:NUDIX domain-containing protein [Bosea sp. 117]|uniref:NUDIX domain-containing protein n=1 Tax=Bosea sp. 117 TaxID=1125973 RepID=UPI000493EFC0|nr:NUDIX domain-containing protein [Bosea sp. 117]